MIKVIGIKIYSEISWHIPSGEAGGDYDTLCGIDANDESIGHTGKVTAPRGQKIDCNQCLALFKTIKSLRLKHSDFVSKSK